MKRKGEGAEAPASCSTSSGRRVLPHGRGTLHLASPPIYDELHGGSSRAPRGGPQDGVPRTTGGESQVDESEAARLLGGGFSHDGRLLDVAILRKKVAQGLCTAKTRGSRGGG